MSSVILQQIVHQHIDDLHREADARRAAKAAGRRRPRPGPEASERSKLREALASR